MLLLINNDKKVIYGTAIGQINVYCVYIPRLINENKTTEWAKTVY